MNSFRKYENMNVNTLRAELADFLGFEPSADSVQFEAIETMNHDGYRTSRISYYSGEGERIPAFLLIPDGEGSFPGVVVHHQHNGQRHLGKSEVCGLLGDPLQAFGPALASNGIAVLAPDSICFEDRRTNRRGTEPDEGADVEQHFNEMCYRLLRGDTLMRKVLLDSAQAITLMSEHPQIDKKRIGMLGHSYGGNTTLFHAALDERIRFACASGAACTYEYKMANQLGIEMAEVIPGFASRFDIQDLVASFSSRRLLLISATNDPFSQDADWIVGKARTLCAEMGASERIEHIRYDGGHAMTQDRFDTILDWLFECVSLTAA